MAWEIGKSSLSCCHEFQWRKNYKTEVVGGQPCLILQRKFRGFSEDFQLISDGGSQIENTKGSCHN